MLVLNIYTIKLTYISDFKKKIKLKCNIYMHKNIHHTCYHLCIQKTFTCTAIINESLLQFKIYIKTSYIWKWINIKVPQNYELCIISGFVVN
jgi:hypothetical protein